MQHNNHLRRHKRTPLLPSLIAGCWGNQIRSLCPNYIPSRNHWGSWSFYKSFFFIYLFIMWGGGGWFQFNKFQHLTLMSNILQLSQKHSEINHHGKMMEGAFVPQLPSDCPWFTQWGHRRLLNQEQWRNERLDMVCALTGEMGILRLFNCYPSCWFLCWVIQNSSIMKPERGAYDIPYTSGKHCSCH